jgi:hypothetical protein
VTLNPVPVSILAEDTLCQVLAYKLLDAVSPRLTLGVPYLGNGFGYIKSRIREFNKAAKGIPLLVVTDLVEICPSKQIKKWLPNGAHPNLVFRIAVKESESWVLADTRGISSFLQVKVNSIPRNVDELVDPKRTLLSLASRSRSRILRQALIPRPGSTAVVGPDYNSTMSSFVRKNWNLNEASQNSPSLRRALASIKNFKPNITE